MSRDFPNRVSLLAVAVATVGIAGGCSEFPCVGGQVEVTQLPGIEFSYEGPERVRYTYWFEDGAQRAVFDRESVPDPARAAVLVHVESKTDGELHGATGWVADVRPEERSVARVLPMAVARTTAHGSWSGDWTARWVATRSGIIANAFDARRQLEANLERMNSDENSNEPPEAGVDVSATKLPSKVRQKLSDEGISLDAVKRDRALRTVAMRQPTARDFGLTVDVEPIWIFVEDGCGACDAALTWLDQNGHGYHAMRIADPTNSRTLRSLAARVEIEPAVPLLWRGNSVLRGFEAQTWERALTTTGEP